MHELSIALALVEQMEKVAREQKARAVPRVTVVVGTLSGVDAEALRGAFPLAAEGSIAEGAELVITPVPASVRCRRCGRVTTPDVPFLRCAGCGGCEVDVVSGRELHIHAMDVEVAEGSGGE